MRAPMGLRVMSSIITRIIVFKDCSSLKIRKPTLENINKYKYYANTYNYLLRKAKHYYYNKKFEEYSGNLRKTWETIRELIGKNKTRMYIPDFFSKW